MVTSYSGMTPLHSTCRRPSDSCVAHAVASFRYLHLLSCIEYVVSDISSQRPCSKIGAKD